MVNKLFHLNICELDLSNLVCPIKIEIIWSFLLTMKFFYVYIKKKGLSFLSHRLGGA